MAAFRQGAFMSLAREARRGRRTSRGSRCASPRMRQRRGTRSACPRPRHRVQAACARTRAFARAEAAPAPPGHGRRDRPGRPCARRAFSRKRCSFPDAQRSRQQRSPGTMSSRCQCGTGQAVHDFPARSLLRAPVHWRPCPTGSNRSSIPRCLFVLRQELPSTQAKCQTLFAEMPKEFSEKRQRRRGTEVSE